MSNGVINVKNPAIVHMPIVAAKLLPISDAFVSNIGWIHNPTPVDINDTIFKLRMRLAKVPLYMFCHSESMVVILILDSVENCNYKLDT